ncbi:carbohydrate ABC transporter permease [Ruminococcaceae bacterium OttesenSCG-928-L11]|nr:carbohydrate ABC transporter permease [Ruminococcaceae bacterium OttesenSCG-928-L11]
MKFRTKEDYIVDTVNYILLGIVAIVTIYPFWYVFVLSFNDGYDALVKGIYFWPRKFVLDNYIAFFTDGRWLSAFGVSVVRTVIGGVCTTLFTCMVAYAHSRPNLMFRRFYSLLLIFCMYFSGGLIPFYVTLRSYNLLNKFWVYIIPGLLSYFFVIVARSFFSELPPELMEAAKIDGASDLGIFFRVVLPVSTPLLATMLLFQAVNHWNSWVDSAYYVRDESLRTLSYRMMEVINKSNISDAMAQSSSAMAQMAEANRTTSFSLQCASLVVCIIPILCVYPFLQKHFVQGMMIGAVKG